MENTGLPSSDSGIIILGGEENQQTIVDTPVVTEQVEEVKSEETPKKEETPKSEPKEETKGNAETETPKVEKTEKTKSTDKPKGDEDDDKGGEPLEITFADDKTKSKEVKKPQETATVINDDIVKNYLETTHGLKVKYLTDLSKKEVLSEQVQAFKKFNEETNGTIADLYIIQRDWGKVSDDVLLESYFRRTDPNLSPDDVSRLIELKKVTEDDELNLDEREFKQRKIDYARLISKAKGYMVDYQEKYKVSLETGKAPKQQTAEEITKAHEPYWKLRDKSLKDLPDIKMSIKGLGDVIIPIEDADRDLVAKNTQTLDAFIERFKNKDGSLNTEKTVRSTLYSDEDFFKRAVQTVADQVYALTLVNFSKENRNVDLDQVKKNETKQEPEEGLVIIKGQQSDKGFAPKVFGQK